MKIRTKDEFIEYRLKQGVDFIKILDEWEKIRKFSHDGTFETNDNKRNGCIQNKSVDYDDQNIVFNENENINVSDKSNTKWSFTKEDADNYIKKTENLKSYLHFIFIVLYAIGFFSFIMLQKKPEIVNFENVLTKGIFYTLVFILVVLVVYNSIIKLYSNTPKNIKIEKYIKEQEEIDDEKIKQERLIEEENVKRSAERERILIEEKKRIKQMEERQKQERKDYWYQMDGYKFEIEITKLYRKNGFNAIRTKGSNDGGYDIYLKEHNSVSTIIQCKAYKNKLSPSTARELYGVMHSINVTKGVIICLGGFSYETRKFVEGKNIKLMDVNDIIEFSKLSD